jgi:hypothetical protein
MEFDYEKDLAIDPHMLDEEWLLQPVLAYEYGKELAYAKRVRDKAAENVKIVRSNLVKDASKNLDKPTVANVESYYRTHNDHLQAKDELIEAEFTVNVLQAAVDAISWDRRASLENEVKLYLGQYFAGPKEPRDIATGKRMLNLDEMALERVEDAQRKALHSKRGKRSRRKGDGT